LKSSSINWSIILRCNYNSIQFNSIQFNKAFLQIRRTLNSKEKEIDNCLKRNKANTFASGIVARVSLRDFPNWFKFCLKMTNCVFKMSILVHIFSQASSLSRGSTIQSQNTNRENIRKYVSKRRRRRRNNKGTFAVYSKH
jgi:hypothetical protein